MAMSVRILGTDDPMYRDSLLMHLGGGFMSKSQNPLIGLQGNAATRKRAIPHARTMPPKILVAVDMPGNKLR